MAVWSGVDVSVPYQRLPHARAGCGGGACGRWYPAVEVGGTAESLQTRRGSWLADASGSVSALQLSAAAASQTLPAATPRCTRSTCPAAPEPLSSLPRRVPTACGLHCQVDRTLPEDVSQRTACLFLRVLHSRGGPQVHSIHSSLSSGAAVLTAAPCIGRV